MRRPDILTTIALGALLVFGLAACGVANGSTASSPDGSWVLIGGTGPDGEVPILDSHPITLQVDGDEWGGTAACNSYGGTVEVDGGNVRVIELWQTEMACEPAEVMESESAYLRALRDVDTVSDDEDGLTLLGPEGTRLVYEPAQGDTDAA